MTQNRSLATRKKSKPLDAKLTPHTNPGLVQVSMKLSGMGWALLARYAQEHVVSQSEDKSAGGAALAAILPKFLGDCRKKSESVGYGKKGTMTVSFAIALFVHKVLGDVPAGSLLDNFYMDLDKVILDYDEEYLV